MGMYVTLHGWVQVAQRAGEIAKELGLINKADQADTTSTASTNSTGGNWMNLNLFSRNESDSSNSSWYSAGQDESVETSQAAAALQRYQQLDLEDEEELDADLSPLLTMTNASAAVANDTAIGALMYNVTMLDRTRPQSRAERAGSKQQLVLL